jgi:lycopene cyclase domain-containing protein
MIGLTYLAAIVFSMFGMVTLDHKYMLALFHDYIRTILTVATGVIVFIVWDILGITLGIFFAGTSPYMTGLFLAPDFPIEELFFLTFLCYFTLILYRLLETRWRHI